MNAKFIFLLILLTSLMACEDSKKNPIVENDNAKISELRDDNTINGLLNTKCYICHSINSESHDVIIAPPMAAVKRRYLRSYRDKENFVEAITKWTMDPKVENALMPGAVDNFNVMPNQVFIEEEIRKIATYIYENELEEPDWFAEHQKEMHGNGMRQERNRRNGSNF